MKTLKNRKNLGALALACAALCAVSGAQSPQGQATDLLRATELRADKLGSAAVIAPLAVGARVHLLSLEGGWAYVDSAGQLGWVRASMLKLDAGSSVASTQQNGRQAAGGTVNAALTLGVRSLPPRDNRHALIIGISRYADANTPPLPGAHIDRESATQMAVHMQVPVANIKYLQDEQATGENIRNAIKELNAKVQDGDKVFIHYSGHGTRFKDEQAGGCVEALLAYDGGWPGTITNREMSTLLSPITAKTDKLIVMYDACHSGGLISNNAAVRTRGATVLGDEGLLRPKFSSISEECGKPTNIKTRNLVVEAGARGALPQDIIHISAARDNEISFDDEQKGGLATQFMRDCMLRDAKDLDGSGAISVEEIKVCAQEKLNKRMERDPNFKAHNITLSGNSLFVPAWFSQATPGTQVASLAPVAMAAAAATTSAATKPLVTLAPGASGAQTAAAAAAAAAVAAAVPPKPATPAVAAPAAPTAVAVVPPAPAVAAAVPAKPATPVVVAAPAAPAVVAAATVAAPAPAPVVVPQLTGAQALKQMYEQRDAKRTIRVAVGKDKVKIGQDYLDFSVQSERAGYVYVALAGSDNKSLYLLFPNDLDQNNKVEANLPLALPRANWRVKAQGPTGTNNLLVIVSDGPRDIASFQGAKAGPFMTSLNDSEGRAKLGALMTTSRAVSTQECATPAARKNNPVCSDAYGAASFTIEEVK